MRRQRISEETDEFWPLWMLLEKKSVFYRVDTMKERELQQVLLPFQYRKVKEMSIVKIPVNKHMKKLFEKKGSSCTGYDWCKLAISFIDQDEVLGGLARKFEYEPEEESFSAGSSDDDALRTFALAFRRIYDDEKAVKRVMNTDGSLQ